MNRSKLSRTDNCCSICKAIQKPQLSWDHVPPKGGLDLSDMEIRNYSEANFNPNSLKRTISQNGLKFRSLCNNCNNELGSRYDKCFNLLMQDIKQIVTSKLILPNVLSLKTYPTKIIKAILGHLLASKVEYCDAKSDNIIRAYLFNDSTELPDDVRIYYWLFPYDCTIIRHDILQLNPNTGEQLYYSIIKSFPLGFAITYQCELEQEGFIELTKYTSNDIEKQETIPLYLSGKYEWDFPENIHYSGVQLVMEGANDIYATKKR